MSAPPRESLLDALPQGAALLDRRGAIAAVNAEFARFAGKAAPSLAGMDFFDAFGFIPAVREAREPYLVDATPVLFEAESPRFGAVHGNYRVRLASFGDGPGRGALFLVDEISAELRERADAEAIGAAFELVSRVRHEVNNSLMAMLGQLEILLSGPDLAEAIRKRVEKVFREAERIRDRVTDLAIVRKS